MSFRDFEQLAFWKQPLGRLSVENVVHFDFVCFLQLELHLLMELILLAARLASRIAVQWAIHIDGELSVVYLGFYRLQLLPLMMVLSGLKCSWAINWCLMGMERSEL